MYSISPSLVDNYSTNESLNLLIKSIDIKIIAYAGVQYNNIRLGLDNKVDFEEYQDLCRYKEILLEKLLGCNCLDNEMLIMIVSKIKKLIK